MRLAAKYYWIGLTTIASVALTGCPTVRMPDLYHPGPAGYQRANALQFDPYPLDDVAPPVAGARPREYERPIPEVKRGQTYTPKRPNLQPIPWPSLSLPAAPTLPAVPAPAMPYQTPAPVLPPASTMVRPPY